MIEYFSELNSFEKIFPTSLDYSICLVYILFYCQKMEDFKFRYRFLGFLDRRRL